jgi:hypothetical protein
VASVAPPLKKKSAAVASPAPPVSSSARNLQPARDLWQPRPLSAKGLEDFARGTIAPSLEDLGDAIDASLEDLAAPPRSLGEGRPKAAAKDDPPRAGEDHNDTIFMPQSAFDGPADEPAKVGDGAQNDTVRMPEDGFGSGGT